MATTDMELDSRLARADSAEAFEFDAALLDRLASDARAAARRRSVRARLAGAGIAFAVVVGVGIATPAVAEVVRAFFAQTGQVPAEDSAGSEAVPGSEWIDISASDLRDYIEAIYPDWLPLTPCQDPAALIDQVAGKRERNPGLQQEVTIRLRFEWLVLDAWVDEWIAVLMEAREWPASLASRRRRAQHACLPDRPHRGRRRGGRPGLCGAEPDRRLGPHEPAKADLR